MFPLPLGTDSRRDQDKADNSIASTVWEPLQYLRACPVSFEIVRFNSYSRQKEEGILHL